jgi:two-component sensor histidine kinase
LQEYMTHPVFISLILWVILVLLIPPVFSRYRIRHIRDEYTSQNVWEIFSDFDNDKQSEKISLDLNDPEQTKIMIIKNNKILDEQYNLKYQPHANNIFYAGDYNRDGYLEFYVFTMNQDSVFLNVIDPVILRKAFITGRFIDFRRRALQSDDKPEIEIVDMIEDRSKNFNDLIFFIKTGFSKQPRRVYRYLIAEDSLIKSPESGVVPLRCIVADINNDFLPEFILSVQATSNYDELFPYTDQFSWLMVLDNKLKFLFPPVKFSKYPSRLMANPLKLKNQSRLVVFNDYYGTDSVQSSFCLFDSNGNKISEKPVKDFESAYNYIFINNDYNKSTFYFLKNRDAQIDEIDSSLQVINTIDIPELEIGKPLAQLDADRDGEKEYLFQGGGYRSLIITRSNFRQAVSFYYKKEGPYPLISQVFATGSKPMIYLQFKDYGSFIQYYRNPFYFFKYPFYGALYLTVFIFIVLIGRIQQYRLSLKLQTEKRIASLQMKAIKNQIDPHFTLNILNAIGSLYASEENRDNADYLFAKYARLIRQTVISSDQIIITLAEEMDFLRNYIDLERFRCNNSFNYKIDIGKDVDLQTKIPRMLIYTFVENAIKYGLKSQTGNGLLKIVMESADNNFQVIVEDNGPGLVSQQESVKGTGKGLLILNELIDLYYKLEKIKITYTLQDIGGPGSTVSGTRAIIEIPQGGARS